MKPTFKLNLVLVTIAFGFGLVLAFFLLREPTVPLTLLNLKDARGVWRQAGVADYDTQYVMHKSEYDVAVRAGIVTSLKVDGRVPLATDWRAYSVDGLFDILELELAGNPMPKNDEVGKAKPVMMRVRFNRELGYVERYIRGSGGFGKATSIRLISFLRSH